MTDASKSVREPTSDESLLAAIEGNYSGMSRRDLLETVELLSRGRARWRKEAEDAQRTIEAMITERLDQLANLTRQRDGLVKELDESFALAEGQLAAEKLSGNVVKEEFWKGELAALHRMRCVMEAAKGDNMTAEITPETLRLAVSKRRMKPNLKEKGYHSREHDEDPTCHKTHEGDTPCEPVETNPTEWKGLPYEN